MSAGGEGSAIGDASGCVWDTRPGGPLNNVIVAAAVPGGWKLMNGPDDYHASINILLKPGANAFAISGTGDRVCPTTPTPAAAINLFLDSKIVPSISVKRLPGAPFTANTSPNTFDMNGAPAPAAGALEYDNGLEIVKVIDFYWLPDELGNFSGYIVIVVTPKPDILSIRVSEVQICWYSETNVDYQPVYQSELTTNIWTPFGAPIAGTGERICIRDATPLDEPRRLYRIIKSER